LTLRLFDEGDRPWVSELLGDRTIYAYLTDLTDPDAGRLWFDGVAGRRNYGFLMICHRHDHRRLGLIVIHRFPDRGLHVGGFLGSDDRGQGYAAEAVRALRDLAGDMPLYADIDPENARARHLMDAIDARRLVRNVPGRLEFQL
jgi:RimJ/RimL family protein N-acetyltransferase